MATPKPTLDEVREAVLIDNLPPGARDVFDFDNPASNVYKEIDADAQAVKAHATDQASVLRDETLASSVSQNIPTWEDALNFTDTTVANFGANSQRVGQIVSRLREWGTPTHSAIKASLAAICGYEPDIVEVSRTALDLLVGGSFGAPGDPIAAGANVWTRVLADNAPCSTAGARLALEIDHAAISDLTIRLTAPDATFTEWAGSLFTTTVQRLVWWPEASGKTITGTWTLTITNAGATAGTLEISRLTLDGIGRAGYFSSIEGYGGAIHEWAVLVDTANAALVAAGTYDATVALDIVRRWNPAHCRGYLAQKNGSGGSVMIFDDILTPFEMGFFA